MQYASFQFNEDISLLIDAAEYEFPLMKVLDMDSAQRKRFIDSIKIIEHNYENLPFYLVYGAFLPNDWLDSSEVLSHIKWCADHVLMTFRWTTTFTRQCETIGIVDVAPISPHDRLSSYWIPLAALVRAQSIPALTDDGAGVSYFLRYTDLNAFDNLLNRSGIFCFKSAIEYYNQFDAKDWKNHIDEEELRRVFNSIR